MLRSAQSMIGYRVRAGKTEIGRLGDLLFDTGSWLERYWVINSSGYLETRDEVFVPIGLTDWVDHALREITLSTPVGLIEKSPNLRDTAPGSKWPQPRYSEHYHWPFFWTGAGTLGTATVRPPSEPIPAEKANASQLSLYSSVEAFRYRLRAREKRAGHVEDFLLDDQTWSIRYVVVTARRWWPTRAAAITTHWINGISWKSRVVSVDLPAAVIRKAPRFDRVRGITPEFEESLIRHYAGSRYKEVA